MLRRDRPSPAPRGTTSLPGPGAIVAGHTAGVHPQNPSEPGLVSLNHCRAGIATELQGYLAHKKSHPPGTLQ